MRTVPFSGLLLVVPTVVAAAVTLGLVYPTTYRTVAPANDLYGMFYPDVLYAWRSLREGGGLWWNPYVQCGTPFFGGDSYTLLDPFNLVFGVLDREAGLLVMIALRLVIGGLGMMLLCRTLGLGTAAAVCGAIAFELGDNAVQLTTWTPSLLGPYVWMPVALWRLERLLQQPNLRSAVLLGTVFTFQWLPGHPQILFHTYLLVVLRVGWALLTSAVPTGRVLLASVVAMVFPLALGGVSVLPWLEVARESLRSRSDLSDIGSQTARSYLARLAMGSPVPLLLAAGGLGGWPVHALRRPAAFYLMAALIFSALSLGDGTPLYDLYARLPFTAGMRHAARFCFPASIAITVLAAFGAESLMRGRPSSGLRIAIVLGTLAFIWWLRPVIPGIWRWDWVPAVFLLTGAIAGMKHWTFACGVIALVTGTWLAGLAPGYVLNAGDLYGSTAPAYAFMRERLTPQDRAWILGRAVSQWPLTPRLGQVVGVPNIHDYNPFALRAYAEFFTYLRLGRPLAQFDDYYWAFGLPNTVQRKLVDLVSTRYLLVDRHVDRVPGLLKGGIVPVAEFGDVRIYENQQALPRARFVPQARVFKHEAMLAELARPGFDPERRVLLERAPPVEFMWTDRDGKGNVEIVLDAPERIGIRAQASTNGFLVLSDTYFSAWRASVDGERVEVLRANYAFRAVPLPAGEHEVVFEYDAWTVRWGAGLTGATILVLASSWWWTRRSRALKTG